MVHTFRIIEIQPFGSNLIKQKGFVIVLLRRFSVENLVIDTNFYVENLFIEKKLESENRVIGEIFYKNTLDTIHGRTFCLKIVVSMVNFITTVVIDMILLDRTVIDMIFYWKSCYRHTFLGRKS